MRDFPLSAIDRKIDELGEEARIQSEADAEAYVEALVGKFGVDESLLPIVGALKAKLARAEFDAVRYQEKRIPEGVVAETFNGLMDRWGAPTWTRISVEELHAFRAVMSTVLYPRSVSRSSDGQISRNCRPVEAIYLIYLLQSRGGVSVELRERVKSGKWPRAMRENCERSARLVVRLKTDTSPEEMRRLREYLMARAKHFADHTSSHVQRGVNDLFERFHIY